MRAPQGREIDADWPAFARDYLNVHKPRPTKDGELYSAALYRDGHVQRADANVIGMSAVIIDFDNADGRGNDSRCTQSPTLPEDHADNLAGLTYAWHSTYTHTPQWPRWRLVIPLDRICTPDEWPHVFAGVMVLLGGDGNVDLSCRDLSRAYWAPAAPADRIQDAMAGFAEGETAKVSELIDLGGGVSKIIPFPPQGAPVATVPTAGRAGRNDALKAQVAACIAKGKGLDEIVREVIDYDQRHHNPPLFADIAEGMRADPYTNAVRFVANNLTSINSRRVAAGEAPQVPGALPAAQPSRLNLVWFADAQPILNTSDFLEDVLCDQQMSVIYGDSNCGKTFLALDMALHIAQGWPWHGKQTETSGVIYVAAEGGYGIYNRLQAFRQHYGITAAVPLAVCASSINLLKPNADTPALINLIKTAAAHINLPVRLVVIDTLSRAMAGGNENSSEDMGALVLNANRIQSETGAHLSFVHHSGKDQAKGARGHSLLRAASDTEIEVVREFGPAIVTATKQRELEGGEITQFSLRSVQIGTNHRGKPITSCVVMPANVGPITSADADSVAGRALAVLAGLFDQYRANVARTGRDPSAARVTLRDWKAALVEAGLLGRVEKNFKQQFFKRKEALERSGHIQVVGGFVTITAQG